MPPAVMDRAKPKRLAFVLIPGFSLVTLGCAIEAFRMANERAAPPPFVCRMLGVRTRQVATNTGLVVTADDIAGGDESWDIIFIISSLTSTSAPISISRGRTRSRPPRRDDIVVARRCVAMKLATRADLEKLVGNDLLRGLSRIQLVAAIAEARLAFAETGDRHRAAEAVRSLVERMRR